MINPFEGIEGHEAAIRILTSSVEHPAPAYLFHGPPNAASRDVAERFVRTLIGIEHPTSPLSAHPDCIVLLLEEGKKDISVEQVRELRERVSLTPAVAKRVVAFVPYADRLNVSGMNALLKVLEEPPADAVFVLVADDISRIPETVKSRSVALRFEREPGRPVRNGDGSGAGFVRSFLDARTLGARLTAIETLSKECESAEDSTTAWREVILSSMDAVRSMLVEQGSDAVALGHALLAAWRLIGSAVSPRLALEAAAVRLGQDLTDRTSRTFIRNVMPTHMPRGMPAIFDI